MSGLGIGLYLAKRIVELHSGTIEAVNDGPASGALFRVCLPLTDKVARNASNTEQDAAEVAAPGKRLLIVDDNRDAADSMGILLEQVGHQVRIAYDGNSAVKIALDFAPHVVLLDLALPDITGHEVCRRLRASSQLKGAKIVALTGFGSNADALRAVETGFDEHIVKPASLEAITMIINRA